MLRAFKIPTCLFYILTLVVLSSGFGLARAADDCKDHINDRQSCEYYEEEWQESKLVIPPLPKDNEFKQLAVTEASERYTYYMDEKSITLGTDGVMRYTVAVVSSSGVRNIFYEGLRCDENEVKTYAYASKGGKFRPTYKSRWRTVSNKGASAYQDFLKGVIVCDSNGFPWDAEKARNALNKQYLPNGQRRGLTCRSCDSDGFTRNE
jgi:hypothetical protein